MVYCCLPLLGAFDSYEIMVTRPPFMYITLEAIASSALTASATDYLVGREILDFLEHGVL